MTIIWRVENQSGRGPYNPGYGACIQFFFPETVTGENHPPPSSCPILSARWRSHESEHEVFGFQTSIDFKLWFHEFSWREWLARQGFFLREFETNDCAIGLRQVIFDRSSAILLRSHSPLVFG
jgi:hypothetical protein